MKLILKALLLFNILFNHNYYSIAQVKWPDGKKAVIVLTYDDALKSQLDIAIPQLDKQKMPGTFFLDGRISIPELARWKAASNHGHELANHSLYHPCSQNMYKNNPRWYTESYNTAAMISEITMMNKLLFTIDGRQSHSYAYPCTETLVNGRDYVDTLRATGVATYARVGGGNNTIITSKSGLDLFRVPSYGVAPTDNGDALIAYVKKVEQAGGLGIFMFHGVGGDYITVAADAHQHLVDYLAKHKKEIWVTTFSDALKYLEQH